MRNFSSFSLQNYVKLKKLNVTEKTYLTRICSLSFRRLHHIEKGRGRNQSVYNMDVTYMRTYLWMIITLIYVVVEVKPSELHEGEPNVCQHTETYVTHFTFCWFIIYELNSFSCSLEKFCWKKGYYVIVLFSLFILWKSHNNNRVDFFIFKNFFSVKFFFTSAVSLHFFKNKTIWQSPLQSLIWNQHATFFWVLPTVFDLEQIINAMVKFLRQCALCHLSCYTCLTPFWTWINLPRGMIIIAGIRSHSRQHSVKQSGPKQTHGVLTFHRDAQNGCK